VTDVVFKDRPFLFSFLGWIASVSWFSI